ncbi:MAG: GNAT family N-acetyltransferase [Bacteroidia bacterium]
MKIILETPRLLLREFTLADKHDFFALNSDWEVVQYTGNLPFENMEAAVNVLENVIIKGQYEKYGMGRWAVIEKESQALLGWCGVRPNENDGEIDLGYRYFRQYWGKGFATEAAKAVLEYAKNELQLAKIAGKAQIENIASIKVLSKIGMERMKDIEENNEKLAYFVICLNG